MSENQVRLFTRWQVTLAGFIGGPLGAAWAARRSAQALDMHQIGKKYLLIGAGLFLLAFIFGSLSKTDASPGVIGLLFFMPIVLMFDSELKGKCEHALAEGAARHSWWRALGVGVLGFLVAIIAFIPWVLLVPIQPWNTLEYGDNIIYYEGAATEQEARKLAVFLENEGVFHPDDAWNLTLVYPKHKPGAVIVEIVVDEPVQGSETDYMLRALRQIVASHYPNRHVEIHAQNLFGITKLRIQEHDPE